MNPIRCGNQVYSTGSPSAPASRDAILFSNPSPRSLDQGR